VLCGIILRAGKPAHCDGNPTSRDEIVSLEMMGRICGGKAWPCFRGLGWSPEVLVSAGNRKQGGSGSFRKRICRNSGVAETLKGGGGQNGAHQRHNDGLLAGLNERYDGMRHLLRSKHRRRRQDQHQAINIRVVHQNDPVIPELIRFESFTNAGTQSDDEVFNLF